MKFKLLAILITAISIAGCNSENPNSNSKASSETKSSSSSMSPMSHPTIVVVDTISSEPVEVITELKGRVVASLVSEVRPQVTGIIKERLFEEGQEVEEGQVLYKIDPAQYIANTNQAKAALKTVEADISSALLKYKRYQSLVKERAVSKQDVEEAQAAYNKLLATLEERKAALNIAQINLDYTSIKSPISGSIGISNITPGALVTANQSESLTTITKLDTVNIDITQQSTDFLNQQEFKSKFNTQEVQVDIFLDNGEKYPVKGVLKTSEVIVNPNTNSITLRAVVDNPNKNLLPGMYVKVALNNGVNPDGITVFHQSVFYDSLGVPNVLVVNKENKIETKQISIAGSSGNKWIITEGLNIGDKVVFQGRDKVKSGDKVVFEELKKTEEVNNG